MIRALVELLAELVREWHGGSRRRSTSVAATPFPVIRLVDCSRAFPIVLGTNAGRWTVGAACQARMTCTLAAYRSRCLHLDQGGDGNSDEAFPLVVHPGARQGVAPGNRSGPRRSSVRSRMPLVERPGGYAECVPRPRRDLTTTEKRHLHSLEGRISRLEAELQATRREWAELVEEAGQAAVARELGVSRQAVADRLRRIRANREGRSGRR
jgi:hypothetical protein